MVYHQVYIGLGSNLGDRLNMLQQAIEAIHRKVGSLEAVSSVYETPALGFDGPDFLNACCSVKSPLSPHQLLEALQAIERDMGRQAKTGDTYISRQIDLDILLYDQEIVLVENTDTTHLMIPHPRLHERRFVLEPLHEIAPQLIHPQLNRSIDTLLKECSDRTEIRRTDQSLQLPVGNGLNSPTGFLAIEGNIGSGKTSLAQMIAREFRGQLMLEGFKDNYFLPKFYEDPQRYAFTLEMSFLRDRHQQWAKRLTEIDLSERFLISDYSIKKSLVFSKINLTKEEYHLYESLFYQLNKNSQPPRTTIYLHQDIARLKYNIVKRGRPYEQGISSDYLKNVQEAYLEFLKNNSHGTIKIIDLKGRDFVENEEDYRWILDELRTIL